MVDFFVKFNLIPLVGLFLFGTLEATFAPLSVTLEELKASEVTLPQVISIRGFLYQNASGQWLLLNAPNLKSCCLAQQTVQIHVEGESLPSPTPGTALLLTGELHQHQGTYTLKKAHIVAENTQTTWLLLAGIGGCLLAIFFIRGRRAAVCTPAPESTDLSSHLPIPPSHPPSRGTHSPTK